MLRDRWDRVKALNWVRTFPRTAFLLFIALVIVPVMFARVRQPRRTAARAALAAAREHPAVIARVGENARPDMSVGTKMRGKNAEVVLTLRGEEREMTLLVGMHEDVNGWVVDRIDRVEGSLIQPLGPGPRGGFPYR